MNDYPNNETLIAIIDAIDETKQNKEDENLTTSDKTVVGAINELHTLLENGGGNTGNTEEITTEYVYTYDGDTNSEEHS